MFFTAVKYTCCRLNVCVPCKICTLESDVICPLAAGSLSIMFSRSSHTVSVLCSCFWHTGVQASVYIPALGAMSVRCWPLGAPGRGYTQVIDSSLDKSYFPEKDAAVNPSQPTVPAAEERDLGGGSTKGVPFTSHPSPALFSCQELDICNDASTFFVRLCPSQCWEAGLCLFCSPAAPSS